MKSLSLCLTFILIVFSIALPASFGKVNSFALEDSILISDLVESEEEREEAESDDDISLIELIEEEVINSNGQIRLFSGNPVLNNFDYRKVYISSYTNSIFIPPLA